MKIILVHNEYGKYSGEESVVESQIQLLEGHGHQVCPFTRSSAELDDMRFGRLYGFCCGIYNPLSVRSFRQFLIDQIPDIIHIHNLYPLISPAVLHVCNDFNIPVVMTLHNYRLICPNGMFLTKGKICESCKSGREYWCVLKNCEGSIAKSLGYALRNFVARIRKSYLDNVDVFAALTDFQRQKLVSEGYPADRVAVVPNMCDAGGITHTNELGEYVGYVGRVSPEKGVNLLVKVAEKHPDIPFQAAGAYSKAPELVHKAPTNFKFLGHLQRNRVDTFIEQSRFIVLSSIWYEGFPMILVEAMLQGRPVVASRLGGIPEIVEDGVTGLLFEAGNTEDLAQKVRFLWDHPCICRKMGEAGREKALREYTSKAYYIRLIEVYQKAQNLCRG